VKFVDLRARQDREEGEIRKSALRATLPAPPGEAGKTEAEKKEKTEERGRDTSPVRSVTAEGGDASAPAPKGKGKGKPPWKGKKGKGKPWTKNPRKGAGKSG
jgi:hypothetical protein